MALGLVLACDSDGERALPDAAPADSGPGDSGPDGPPALSFQQVSYLQSWGPCPEGNICSQSIDVYSDGSVTVRDRERTFSGTIAAAEVEHIARQAMSQEVIAGLRGRTCLAGPHVADFLTVTVAPGLLVRGLVTSCDSLAIVGLKETLRALAERLFPETQFGGVVPPPDAATVRALPQQTSLALSPRFVSLTLEQQVGTCPDAASCSDWVSIYPDEQGVVRRKAGSTRSWQKLGDRFGAVTDAAMAPDLRELLQAAGSCATARTGTERLSIEIGDAVYFHGTISSCQHPALDRLKRAIDDLLAALEVKQVLPGAGLIWLASTAPRPTDPKYYEMRPRVDIAGVVTSVKAGPAAPPPALQTFFITDAGASQVLTIAGDDGLQWSLGYLLERGQPAVDVTPDLRALVGTRVSLLFRAVRAFGTAPGFVLSDPSGVRFAMDLAVYGDPLLPDDVPGLTVADGPVLLTKQQPCADQNHTSLVFTGDTAVDVAGGSEADVTIKGQRYRAINLFSYRAAGPVTCTDITGEARGWAVWRAP